MHTFDMRKLATCVHVIIHPKQIVHALYWKMMNAYTVHQWSMHYLCFWVSCLLVKCWECSIHTCISGQPHLSATFWSLVVVFSLGTCRSVCVFFPIKFPCVGLVFSDIYSRPIGRGGSRGFARTPCWPPKHFIYTTIVQFKCPTGPLVVSLILRITAVQPSLVAAMRVCS